MQTATLERTFFGVSKKRMEYEGKEGWYVVEDGNDVPLAEVSDRYELVSNRDLVSPFLKRFGPESFTSCLRVGNRFTYKVETGRQMEIAKGDILKEQIVIQNSYDKTRRFSFMFGAFRMVCSNGLYTGQAVINFRKRHVGQIPVDDIVARTLSSYKTNDFTVWRDFQGQKLDYREQIKLVGSFEPFEVQDEEEKELDDKAVLTRWGQPKNARFYNADIRDKAVRILKSATEKDNHIMHPENGWGLYNVINTAIASSIRPKAISNIILANQRAESYLIKTFNLN